MRDRVLYRETYKANTKFRNDVLPVLKHADGMQPIRMDLKSSGLIEINGKKLEFQDVRLYFTHEETDGE